MSPEEYEFYKEAIRFWKDWHGSLSPLVTSEELITFYRENYERTRNSNEV